MALNEGSSSPPAILKEFIKIRETVESGEDKIFQLKNLLDQKQTYYEQLQQHYSHENKSVAKKRAQLADLNNENNMADTQNTQLRNEAKLIYHNSCQEAYQCINDIETDLAECEGQLEQTGDYDATPYEKKIDELIKLLGELTEKRNKRLETLESQQERLREESFHMKNQIFECDSKIEMLESDDDADLELEMLDKELKELQSKLSILDDEHFGLNQEKKEFETAQEELEKKYNKNKFGELNTKFSEVNNEVSRIKQNMDIQKSEELKLSNSILNLKECENKLNKEIQETSKFWADLEHDQYGGFSSLEQEIAQIKSEISERNKKFEEAKNSDVEYTELIKEKDEEIELTSSLVNQLSAEIEDIEKVLGDLKTPADFSEQHDAMTKDMEALSSEKTKLEESALKVENEINEAVKQLKKVKDKSELDLLVMENNHLMEVKRIEKDSAEVETFKTDLEERVKSTETEIKQLQETKQILSEREIQIKAEQKDVYNTIEEAHNVLKMFQTKKHELKKKLGSVTAPPPIYMKGNEHNFSKPKIFDVLKKKVSQKPKPVEKRHWDSESSMEDEEVTLVNDFLKKKYKRPSETRTTKK